MNADNYRDYIKQLLMTSAQDAKDYGADIPDSIGFSFSSGMKFIAPMNGGKKQGEMKFPMDVPKDGPKMMPMRNKSKGEYITGLDLDKYLFMWQVRQP